MYIFFIPIFRFFQIPSFTVILNNSFMHSNWWRNMHRIFNTVLWHYSTIVCLSDFNWFIRHCVCCQMLSQCTSIHSI